MILSVLNQASGKDIIRAGMLNLPSMPGNFHGKERNAEEGLVLLSVVLSVLHIIFCSDLDEKFSNTFSIGSLFANELQSDFAVPNNELKVRHVVGANIGDMQITKPVGSAVTDICASRIGKNNGAGWRIKNIIN